MQDLTKFLAVMCWLVCGVTGAYADPVGTSFTYQGRLDQNGEPVTGAYDFELRLFDDPDTGALIGPLVAREDVQVTLGLFTVDLDFGDIFSGDTALWLELAVREGADTGAFATLTPRQRLTPTPHALQATNAEQLGGLSPEQLLQTSGGTLTGGLEMLDSAIEFQEGTHLGGTIFADAEGLTVSTPGNDRVQVQSELHVAEAVGIGVTGPPLQKLEVNGAIALGTTTQQSSGTIRWTGTDFEGFDGGSWQSFTTAADGQFVDLTSDQSIDGSKTFLDGIVASNGLTSLDTLTVGSPSQGESIDLYTSTFGLNLFRVGGSKFGELRTNSDNDFVLQAFGGRLRTQGDLYLQFSSSSSFRDLYAGEARLHDALKFNDSGGTTRGQFLLNGNNVAFFDGTGDGYLEVRDRLHVTGDSTDRYLTFGTSGSDRIFFEEGPSSSRDLDLRLGASSDGTLRMLGNGAVTNNLDVGATLDVEDDIELGRNLIFSFIPTGSNDGQMCFDSTIFGDIVIRCSSSRRYKKNIASFAAGLDVVERLRPVTFEWQRDSTKDLGFVAEEVAEIDPLLATYAEGRVDGVKYDRLTAVLVNAIQEQQVQIEALRALVCGDHPSASACAPGARERAPSDLDVRGSRAE